MNPEKLMDTLYYFLDHYGGRDVEFPTEILEIKWNDCPETYVRANSLKVMDYNNVTIEELKEFNLKFGE